MGIIKSGYTFTDRNEDWATRKATAIRLNKLIEEALWNGATNSDGYAPDDGITPNDPTSLSYSSGVESIQLSWLWTQNTPALKTWIYESDTSTLPASPSFSVGQDQRTFFRENLVAGTTRYYWIKVEARNGRFSNVVGPVFATVATWPVTDTITTNLAKKITRSATAPVAPNEGDVWINTSENNILYRYESGVWNRYQDTRVDSIADEYVLMVTPTASGPSQRILGFRATNQDGGKLISSATRSASVVTIVTSTDHGYSNGNLVSMTGLGYSTTNPNGSYTVTVSNTTTFTYSLPSGGGTETYTVSGAYTAKGTQFVIEADYFSIINSDGTAQESPFTVSSGVVYIKNALIQEVSASKITSGQITSRSITISDGTTPGSGILESSGFTSGSSGWRIRGTGDAEFNSLTVRNGILNIPRVTGGWLKLDGACQLTSTTTDGFDTSIIRVNGGGDNGDTRGGQLDVLGNEYTSVPGYNGSVLLTPGNVTNATIRLRSKGGSDRLIVRDDGDVKITPSTGLYVEGTNGGGLIRNYHYAGTPNFEGWSADGSPASPTAIPSGRISAFKLVGYDGSTWSGNAQIRLKTSEAWTTTAHGTEIEFRVTPVGTTGEISAVTIDDSGQLQPGYGLSVTGTTFSSGTISSNGQINAGGQVSGYLVKATNNGTAAAPAFTFSDTDTGMYYDSTDKIGFSGGGTARLYVSSDRVTIDNVLKLVSTGGTTPAGVQDGTIWYDGTDFKAKTGGTVYTINLV
jgi:hypothetical protein